MASLSVLHVCVYGVVLLQSSTVQVLTVLELTNSNCTSVELYLRKLQEKHIKNTALHKGAGATADVMGEDCSGRPYNNYSLERNHCESTAPGLSQHGH